MLWGSLDIQTQWPQWWCAASRTQLSSQLIASINHQIGDGMSLQPWFLHLVIKSCPFLDSSISGRNYSLHSSQCHGKEIGKKLETRGRTVQTFSYSFLIWVLCYWRKGPAEALLGSPPLPVSTHLLLPFLLWATFSLLKDSVQKPSPSKESPLSPSPGISAICTI